jgi:anti-sigma factor RsiW
MSWIAPETEEAWQECLSAYLDGELPAAERRALEQRLAADPERARQLAALRGVSDLLCQWEAPAPDAAFEYALREVVVAGGAPARRTSHDRRFAPAPLRWRFGLALFWAGVFVGALGVQWTRRPPVPPPPPRQLAAQATTSVLALSADQSRRIHREVEADALKQRFLRALDERQWARARDLADELTRAYPESDALRELHANPALRRLKETYETVLRR